jgi:signal peptidase I
MKRVFGIILIAFVLALLLRLFAFETISVASHAMQESYQTGDRLLIEKTSLGPRMPQSLYIPFSSKIKSLKRPWIQFAEQPYRFPGLSTIDYNDLLIYNDPRTQPNIPGDRAPALFSRCAGLPGDTLQISGSKLYINGKEIQRPLDITLCFHFPYSKNSKIEKCIKNDFPESVVFHKRDTGFVFLTKYEFMKLSVENTGKRFTIEPYVSIYDKKNIFIPHKGHTFLLNKKNLETWRDLLDCYEQVAISRTKHGKYEIDGKETDTYTFKQNYYWVLNDHQGYLNDSRTFGLIPESLIVGRAWIILYSPVKNRLFQKI